MQRLQQLLPGVGEPLAHRRGLGGDVVAAAGHHEGGVLGGALGQAGQRGDHPIADERQGGPHLELLDVLGEVPRGHAGVDALVAGQGGELLDPGLHVVAGDPLPRLDARQVDLVDHGDVVVDHLERGGRPRGRAGPA